MAHRVSFNGVSVPILGAEPSAPPATHRLLYYKTVGAADYLYELDSAGNEVPAVGLDKQVLNGNQPSELAFWSVPFVGDDGYWQALSPLPIDCLPVSADGELNGSELVKADDSRLSNSRTPTAHNHATSDTNSGTFATARLGTGTAAAGKYVDGAAGAWTALPQWAYEPAPFFMEGNLTVKAGAIPYVADTNYTIISVRARCTTAPTGASVLIDVNKNGTTIYGTQGNRPTISATGFNATVGAHSVTTLSDGDYLTVDVDQIGSSVAGANLGVVIRLQRT